MTPHLHVQVLLHGAVVEDRLVRVREQVWLGECDGSAVPFTGAIVGVRAAGDELWVRGECLELDRPLSRCWGDVTLRLTAVLPARLPRDWTWVPDPMLLVATVSLLLLGAFVDMISDDVLAGQVASQGMSGGVYTTEERYREAPVLRGAAEPALPAGRFSSE